MFKNARNKMHTHKLSVCRSVYFVGMFVCMPACLTVGQSDFLSVCLSFNGPSIIIVFINTTFLLRVKDQVFEQKSSNTKRRLPMQASVIPILRLSQTKTHANRKMSSNNCQQWQPPNSNISLRVSILTMV